MGRIKKAKNVSGNSSKKPRQLNKWSEERMAQAIAEAKQFGDNAKLRTIARAWDVPKSTLQRRLKGHVVGAQHCSGRKPVFSEQEENELETVIKDMAGRGFPLTENNIRNLAHQYAAKNGIEGLSSKNGQAGWYWLKGFLRRHPTISVKSPEALSSYRASGMNRQVVGKWFEDYKSLLESKGIIDVPSHIWNLDESGVQDTFKPKHAVGEKGVPLYQIQHPGKGNPELSFRFSMQWVCLAHCSLCSKGSG